MVPGWLRVPSAARLRKTHFFKYVRFIPAWDNAGIKGWQGLEIVALKQRTGRTDIDIGILVRRAQREGVVLRGSS